MERNLTTAGAFSSAARDSELVTTGALQVTSKARWENTSAGNVRKPARQSPCSELLPDFLPPKYPMVETSEKVCLSQSNAVSWAMRSILMLLALVSGFE